MVVGRGVAVIAAIFTLLIITPLAVTGRAIPDLAGRRQDKNVVVGDAWPLVAGTIVFMIVEDLSLIDGLYFRFITRSTIAFGDLTPATALGRSSPSSIGSLGSESSPRPSRLSHVCRGRSAGVVVRRAAGGDETLGRPSSPRPGAKGSFHLWVT